MKAATSYRVGTQTPGSFWKQKTNKKNKIQPRKRTLYKNKKRRKFSKLTDYFLYYFRTSRLKVLVSLYSVTMDVTGDGSDGGVVPMPTLNTQWNAIFQVFYLF